MTDATYLTGHLLIAMPAMQDPNFVKTVTYICEHSDQGALGIVINRPLDMDLGTIFDQLSLESADPELARALGIEARHHLEQEASVLVGALDRAHARLPLSWRIRACRRNRCSAAAGSRLRRPRPCRRGPRRTTRRRP